MYITLEKGSTLLMYKKYTFFKSGSIRKGGFRYTCSCSYRKGCKAFVHVSKDDIIVNSMTEHNHMPITYMRMKSGLYVKI